MTQLTGSKRGPYQKGTQRRNDIIDAAMDAFAHAGYQHAVLQDIAASCGITLAGLLHHFPNKLALLVAVLERRDSDGRAQFDLPARNWQTALRGLVDILRDNSTRPGVMTAFAILSAESLTDDHPAAQWFRDRDVSIREILAANLRSGVADKTIRVGTDPSGLAAEVMAVMDGLQQQWVRQNQEFPMIDIFAGYIERLIKACESQVPLT